MDISLIWLQKYVIVLNLTNKTTTKQLIKQQKGNI